VIRGCLIQSFAVFIGRSDHLVEPVAAFGLEQRRVGPGAAGHDVLGA